jgi:hypothetical protein
LTGTRVGDISLVVQIPQSLIQFMKGVNMKYQFENLPSRKPDTKSTPYTERFEKWLAEARANGLQYVNIFYGEGLNKDTVNYESFCEEFIRIQNAPTLPDREVLGEYSL